MAIQEESLRIKIEFWIKHSTHTAFKKLPQPGMKPGARKNSKVTMQINQNKTCISCIVIGPNSLYFCKTTALTVSDADVPLVTSKPSLLFGRNRPKWVIWRARKSKIVSTITIGMAQAMKRGKSIGSVASGKRLSVIVYISNAQNMITDMWHKLPLIDAFKS